jgi:hypothetical protein
MSVRSQRVEVQLDLEPGEGRVDLVEVALQADRGGLGHGPPLTPAEGFGQQVRGDRDGRPIGQEASQRRHLRFGVDALVVDLLDPGGEQAVEFREAGHDRAGAARIVRVVADLNQELVPDGLEEPLYLPPTCWPCGLAVGEPDPEHCAGPAQPTVDEHRSVVDVALRRSATGCEGDLEGLAERDGVLRIAPAGRHDGAGMVVQERDQDRFAASDVRAVQGIADPADVRVFGLEPAEHGQWRAVGTGPGQAGGGEVPLQGPG